jgi:alanyl-tRNA synthetase
MQTFTADSLRSAFLDFFAKRGHAVIPSASLIPDNDPTILFTTAGMHPLVPFLLGEKHPLGRRLADVQKCIRTQDIDDVGDRRHTTFFEMLGAWSLGAYFKESIIPWTFEFLTGVLGFEPRRLYVSVFRGDETVPPDLESIRVWQELFRASGVEAPLAPPDRSDVAEGARIFQYGKEKNWWGPAGATGPCGPDTEMFYDTGAPHDPAFGAACHPNCDCGRFIEIGNDVFMEFSKTAEGTFEPLAQRNVDIGWGLERLLAMTQGLTTIFETELFAPAMRKLEELSGETYGSSRAASRSMEVIADHVRAATFILGDPRGVAPSNVDQGYVLRRFIRRAIRHARLLRIEGEFLQPLAAVFIERMEHVYPELRANRERVLDELRAEERLFRSTLVAGERHFRRLVDGRARGGTWDRVLTGGEAFHLYDTFGFPLEMTEELAAEEGVRVDRDGYAAAFARHQELSRAGAEQKFAGGLADHSDRTVRMHTATHLLHMALRRVLGAHVMQKGSNITQERLRFDFSHPEKVTAEQLRRVEELVNDQVEREHDISFRELAVEAAREEGVIGDFGERYGDVVKVYTIGDFSREICGGPHVANTRFVGRVKIVKEEASGKGVRRIKAVVEDPPGLPLRVPVAEAATPA